MPVIPYYCAFKSFLLNIIPFQSVGVKLAKKRAFSAYDIEEFLKEAGAERINEGAVNSLRSELEETVNELVSEATFYANHAGRKKLIKDSDIMLAGKKAMGRFRRTRISHMKVLA
jgi:histone H3/H4